MTTQPALNPQVIGIAHYASRALLLRILDAYGMTFEQSIVLNYLLAADGHAVDRDEVVERTAHNLKVTDVVVVAVLDQLEAGGLVTLGAMVELTAAGRDRGEAIRARTKPITAEVYAGLPADDLAVAGRMLATITERAEAALASLP